MMLWILVCSVLVFAGAAMSLAVTRSSQRDVAAGQPKFGSVADITGIWNRETLHNFLGATDSEDRYHASVDEINAIPKPHWKNWLDSTFGDITCLGAALASPLVFNSFPTAGTILLCVAGGYLLIGYIWASLVVIRSGAWKGISDD